METFQQHPSVAVPTPPRQAREHAHHTGRKEHGGAPSRQRTVTRTSGGDMAAAMRGSSSAAVAVARALRGKDRSSGSAAPRAAMPLPTTDEKESLTSAGGAALEAATRKAPRSSSAGGRCSLPITPHSPRKSVVSTAGDDARAVVELRSVQGPPRRKSSLSSSRLPSADAAQRLGDKAQRRFGRLLRGAWAASAARRIQRWLRGLAACRMAQLRVCERRRSRAAAIACARHWATVVRARRAARDDRRAADAATLAERTAATRVLQHAVRRFLAVCVCRRSAACRNETRANVVAAERRMFAAVVLQSWWRRGTECRHFKRVAHARRRIRATTFVFAARAFLQRRDAALAEKWRAIRCDHAVRCIQRAFRSFMHRVQQQQQHFLDVHQLPGGAHR